MAYTKGSRYTKIPGSDNKFLFASKEIQSPVYASTIDLAITDFVFMGAVGTSGTWVETSRKVFA